MGVSCVWHAACCVLCCRGSLVRVACCVLCAVLWSVASLATLGGRQSARGAEKGHGAMCCRGSLVRVLRCCVRYCAALCRAGGACRCVGGGGAGAGRRARALRAAHQRPSTESGSFLLWKVVTKVETRPMHSQPLAPAKKNSLEPWCTAVGSLRGVTSRTSSERVGRVRAGRRSATLMPPPLPRG